MAIRYYAVIFLLLCSQVFGAADQRHGADVYLTGDGAKLVLNNNNHAFSISASPSQSESVAYIWPPADATVDGEALLSDSFGVMRWSIIDISGSTNLAVSSPITLTNDTIGWNSTLIDETTWSDGSNPSNVWTFDVSGQDHTMTAGDGLMTFSHAVEVFTLNDLTLFLQDVGSGPGNLVIGNSDTAPSMLSTSRDNTIIGLRAGLEITNQDFNTYIGAFAGQRGNNDHSTGVGFNALRGTTGQNNAFNTGIGASCGGVITTASFNTFAGGVAGGFLRTGDYNLMLGYRAGALNTAGVIEVSSCIFIGSFSGGDTGNIDNLLVIDSFNRTGSLFGSDENAIIYGVMSEEAANQTLALNANVKLSVLTDNGFVITTGGDGTTSIDTNTYYSQTEIDIQSLDYSLIDGTRAYTGTVSGIFPAISSHLATKEYVDSAITFIEEYFFGDTVSDIGGIYFDMIDMPTGEAKSEHEVSGIDNSDGQPLVNFATIAGVPGLITLDSGIYAGNIHALKSAGGQRGVKIYFEIYSRIADSPFTETLLVNSEESEFLTVTEEHYTLHATLEDDVDIDATDRIIIKWFANGGTGGGNATVLLRQEGDTSAHLNVPISSNILSQIYLRQDGQKPLTDNWPIGFFNIEEPGDVDGSVDLTATTDAATVDALYSFEGNTDDSGAGSHDLGNPTVGKEGYCDRGNTAGHEFFETYYTATGYLGPVQAGSGLSFACWVRPEGSGIRYMAGWGDSGTNRAQFAPNINDSQIGGVSNTNTFSVFVTGGNINSDIDLKTDGLWHHVVATMAAVANVNEIKIYIDGELQVIDDADITSPNEAMAVTETDTLVIATTNNTPGTSLFEGCFDELVFYESVLDEDDVTDIYNRQKTKFIQGSSGSSVDVTDMHGNIHTTGIGIFDDGITTGTAGITIDGDKTITSVNDRLVIATVDSNVKLAPGGGADILAAADLDMDDFDIMSVGNLDVGNIDVNGGTLDGVQVDGATLTGMLFVNDASDHLSQLGSQGTDGQVLTSAGAGLNPAWEDASGGVSDHNLLNNLIWSVAGHTIDTSIDFNGYNITEMGNVTGTDVDITAGTGDYLSVGINDDARVQIGAAGDPAWKSNTTAVWDTSSTGDPVEQIRAASVMQLILTGETLTGDDKPRSEVGAFVELRDDRDFSANSKTQLSRKYIGIFGGVQLSADWQFSDGEHAGSLLGIGNRSLTGLEFAAREQGTYNDGNSSAANAAGIGTTTLIGAELTVTAAPVLNNIDDYWRTTTTNLQLTNGGVVVDTLSAGYVLENKGISINLTPAGSGKAGGTYTNTTYGIFVEAIAGTGTNALNYFLFDDTGVKSVHAGKIRFGDGADPDYDVDAAADINANGIFRVGGVAGLSDTYSFGGGGVGDIATMTFTGGILTGVTTVP